MRLTWQLPSGICCGHPRSSAETRLRSARVTDRVHSTQAVSDRRHPSHISMHNLDAEESVLGACLLSPNALDDSLEVVKAEDFFVPAYQVMFAAIAAMHLKGEPIDALTVADALGRTGQLDFVGGPDRMIMLEGATPTLTHVSRYAQIVADLALRRRLDVAASEISELARNHPGDPQQAVDTAEGIIFGVAERRIADTTAVLHDLLGATLDRLESLCGGGGPQGLITGFGKVDDLLAGISASSLVVVGGRPSMGKTSFALSITNHVAAADIPVLIFSLEMNHEEITSRLLAQDARVDATKMRTGHLHQADWDRITRSTSRLGDAPIWIDDNPAVTVTEIRAKARRLHSRLGHLGLIVVDYLQLMTGRSNAENRQVEIAEISRGLKILAREIGTPVLALSQLSRNLESRGDKRPMLSDLRESGSIEQDADVVMFIYRDEVYDDDSPDKGLAEIIIAKHRNGPTGTARLAFMPQYTLFGNATPQAA